MSDKKPTMQMIADMAGVSRGTVDRVLNNRSYVRQDVRERILEIISETGYRQPSASPRKKTGRDLAVLRLGVLLPNFEYQFLEEVQQGIRSAQLELEDSRVEVYVRRCRTELPGEALVLLDELVRLGVSGLSVCALEDQSVSNRLTELKEAGIPCITFNCDLPESGRILFMGQDVLKSGRLAAELLYKCIRPGEKILAAVGNLKFEGHRRRLMGFQERMRELGFPEENILTAETFNDYGTTVKVVSDLIRKSPALKGIYMANLSVAGCAEAIRETGLAGQVHVVCHDINPSVRQLLLEGIIDFTIPQDFVYQGYAPLIYLTQYLRGKAASVPPQADQSIRILCRENI